MTVWRNCRQVIAHSASTLKWLKVPLSRLKQTWDFFYLLEYTYYALNFRRWKVLLTYLDIFVLFFVERRIFFFSAQKRSSKAVIANFVLKDPRVAQVTERKKIIIRPILEKWTGFGAKNISSGHMHRRKRNIHLLEYRFPYRHMQRIVSFHAFPHGQRFLLILGVLISHGPQDFITDPMGPLSSCQ